MVNNEPLDLVEEAAPETGTFPSWRYGPGDEAMLCETAEDVPEGWEDHPSKVAEPPVVAHDL